jgi:FSR family fosmidomycin resistance protein-like MFS transporter
MQKSTHGEISTSLALPAAATFPILFALSFSHFLNDLIQSLVPAIYPIIKPAYGLDFGQIGLITFAFQFSASLLQPAVGAFTDRHPQPYSLMAGMGFTLIGLIVLATAGSYALLLIGAALVGTGSSIFHPEATRMARVASGGRHGLAQSIFQFGGQTGSAAGPLLAAFVVVPYGQGSLAWFSLAALLAMLVQVRVGRWYAGEIAYLAKTREAAAGSTYVPPKAPAGAGWAVAILMLLMFSKSAYSASFGSFYTFYLIDRFGVSVQTSQYLLFVFLVASVMGALIGGPLGDRIGRRAIIWFSILGALPFTLALPFASLGWTVVLTVVINVIMSSAFAAIIVYAMELLPGRVGFIAGLFYGLSFGLAAISAAVLGEIADRTSIETVYRICAFLPALGLLTWFLPDLRRVGR